MPACSTPSIVTLQAARKLDIRVSRVLTDNGFGYIGRCFAHASALLRIAQKHTRLYRPRTNGQAASRL
ncbi:MAG: hypothetical protein HOP12_09675 [Candidatus Eisenbacteria bacterium]|uniref:Transposase family protein n=1 Tax=Eiseniibacteriota bacterium TaxID=2212470 RepID=A0A849SR02_UNCEI|nr:hypothetical protein [Candidatus Eisenbacteria bacterium]